MSIQSHAIEIGDSYCDKWVAVQHRNETPLVKLTDLTYNNAKEAMDYVTKILNQSKVDGNEVFLYEHTDYRDAEIKIRGWMIKKEILDGYRLGQAAPPMQEMLCSYWANAAFPTK